MNAAARGPRPRRSRLRWTDAITASGLVVFLAQAVDRFANGTRADQWLVWGGLFAALGGQSPRIADAIADAVSRRLGSGGPDQ